MSKIKQSPKLPPDKRRSQLLQAARRLFVSKGYRGTTTHEIAAAAGVTKGALYHHFRSKEELLLEIIKTYADRHEQAMEEMLPRLIDPMELFKQDLRLHCQTDSREQGEMVDLWVQAWRVPRIRRFASRRLNKSLKNLQERLVVPARWKGVNTKDLAVFLISLVHGLSALHMLADKHVDLKTQTKFVEKLLGDNPSPRTPVSKDKSATIGK